MRYKIYCVIYCKIYFFLLKYIQVDNIFIYTKYNLIYFAINQVYSTLLLNSDVVQFIKIIIDKQIEA